jgi:hypothetical protein
MSLETYPLENFTNKDVSNFKSQINLIFTTCGLNRGSLQDIEDCNKFCNNSNSERWEGLGIRKSISIAEMLKKKDDLTIGNLVDIKGLTVNTCKIFDACKRKCKQNKLIQNIDGKYCMC